MGNFGIIGFLCGNFEKFLFYIFFLFATYGVRAGIYGDVETGIDLLLGMAIAFSVVIACIVDARLLGQKMHNLVGFVMLFTWPVSVPIYLIWTRKLKGLFISLGLAVGLFVTYYLSALASWYLADS